MLPVLRMPSAPDTPSTGTWTTRRPALTGMSLLQTWTGSWLPLAFTRLSLLKPLGPEFGPWLIGPPMGPGAAAECVLPVVVVWVLVWVGVWVQSRLTDEVTALVLSSPRAAEMSDSGIWPASTPALTGMSLLQAWSGIWLPLAFTRLSLLKPLGPEAAWATGADTPTRA